MHYKLPWYALVRRKNVALMLIEFLTNIVLSKSLLEKFESKQKD